MSDRDPDPHDPQTGQNPEPDLDPKALCQIQIRIHMTQTFTGPQDGQCVLVSPPLPNPPPHPLSPPPTRLPPPSKCSVFYSGVIVGSPGSLYSILLHVGSHTNKSSPASLKKSQEKHFKQIDCLANKNLKFVLSGCLDGLPGIITV